MEISEKEVSRKEGKRTTEAQRHREGEEEEKE
jgi:hypothetical protein